MAKRMKQTVAEIGGVGVQTYRHPEAESLMRPDVGTQAQFRKKTTPNLPV